MSSTFMVPSPNYSQLQHLSPHRRYKSSVWAYPNDHIFFRSRVSVVPHRPSSSQFDDLESADGEADNASYYAKKVNPASGLAGQDGALQLFTSMPLDILYEIFSHLHPMDVLDLSRTTKRLRQILFTRHARCVWISSLGNVRALPYCPPDLTEPQYASLAFDNWCQSCLAPNVEKILWECRLRYCKNCIRKHFIQEDELNLWLPEDVVVEKPDTIFPLAYIVQPRKRTNGRIKPVYLLSTVQKFLDELQEFALTQDEKALARWNEEKKQVQSMRLTHAALCVYWDTHWAYRRSPRPLPSRLFETFIIIVLTILLAFLWREKLLKVAL